jgi:small subunit ribosomal protein S17
MGHQITGTVVSDKGDKTIVISVVTKKTHPVYKKQYTARDRFMAHDEQNSAKVGDLVSIVETRPQSAKKRFRLHKVIERGGVRFAESDATADIAEVVPEKQAEDEKK